MTTITFEDREALRTLVEQLQTQHNDYTAYPIFLVQKEVEVAGFATEYTDRSRWFSTDDGEPATTEEHAQLEAEYEKTYDEPEGWTRTGVRTHWETVQSFLTRQAAERYKESNAHNLGAARVYTDSAYRNYETQLLQRTLPLLVGLLSRVEELETAIEMEYPPQRKVTP